MNPSPSTDDSAESEDGEYREDELRNPQLKEVLDFYDCYELLPYANHILWLSTVKEAVGRIPFNLDYDDICCLVILTEEISKKATADSQKMNEKQQSLESYVTPRAKLH